MTVLNIDLFLSEVLGEDAAKVYNTQTVLNRSYESDYIAAYAYGNENEPLKVHNRVAAIGAKELGLDLDEYLRVWDEAIEAINSFWETPEEFRDTRYREE
jgi:hypothetical protein